MKKILSVAVASALSAGSVGVFAHVPEAEWEQFKAEFSRMAARVDALEAENAELRAAASSIPVDDLAMLQSDVTDLKSQNKASSWAENIAIKGDFRYRYEYIDVEDRDSRERNRIRARMSVAAALPNDVEVGLGMASGGDDPVSTNQTLGGGGSTKELRLDKAYFKWNATDDLYLQAGKFSNPLYRPEKSSLLWDGDWRPEGISAGWSGDLLFANFLGNWLESDSRRDNDTFAWGLQGGIKFNLGDARLTTALAYYDFPTAGRTPFYGDDDEPEFFGNSSSPDGLTYLYDYEMVELGADLKLNLFDMPLVVFANLVQNQDADDYDTGCRRDAISSRSKEKRKEGKKGKRKGEKSNPHQVREKSI